MELLNKQSTTDHIIVKLINLTTDIHGIKYSHIFILKIHLLQCIKINLENFGTKLLVFAFFFPIKSLCELKRLKVD